MAFAARPQWHLEIASRDPAGTEEALNQPFFLFSPFITHHPKNTLLHSGIISESKSMFPNPGEPARIDLAKNGYATNSENSENHGAHDQAHLVGAQNTTLKPEYGFRSPQNKYFDTGKSIHLFSARSSAAYLPIPVASTRGKLESTEGIFNKLQRIRIGEYSSETASNPDSLNGSGLALASKLPGNSQFESESNNVTQNEPLQSIGDNAINSNEKALEIPVFELEKVGTKDPISLVELLAEEGRKYGAIKVKMPESYIHEHACRLNPDRFTFKANRLLNNPRKNEIYDRLKFYDELIQFHMREPKDGLLDEDMSMSSLDIENRKELVSSTATPEAENPLGGFEANLDFLEKKDSEPVSVKTEDSLPDAKSCTGKLKLPVFLQKFPMMDKRPLDLFNLFRFVIRKGGYAEVINRKLWAQIGRELGYKGKITSSLSSSLKLSYAKILYPLELHLKERVFEVTGDNESECETSSPFGLLPEQKTVVNTGEVSESPTNHDNLDSSTYTQNNGAVKRTHPAGSHTPTDHPKKQKPNMEAPLILGSASEFRRSTRLKISKGFLLNDPHLIDVKTPLVISLRDKNMGSESKHRPESFVSPTGASAQINNYLKWLACYSPVIQDASRLEVGSKLATTCSLRQFIEKDSKFQEFLISSYRGIFDEKYCTSVDGMEQVFWQYLSEKSTESRWLENCSNIPGSLAEGGIHHVGERFSLQSVRSDTESGQSSVSQSVSEASNGTDYGEISFRATNHAKLSQASQNVASRLNPFELSNIPFLPDSLLGALSASDVANIDILRPSLNIGMTFSTENWRCEDHFTQMCSYQAFGKSKRWYFIPESEFEKFEQLLVETIAGQNTEFSRVNKNYDVTCWDVESISKFVHSDDDATPTQYECIYNSLENIVSPYPETRAINNDPVFQRLIEMQKHSVSLNQEYFITPQMLTERGIKYTTTLQKPGEMILKYPKTYSATISFGVNVSEEVNFASKLWLEYGTESEEWLQKQGILPNISTFKLLANYAQLLENPCSSKISYSPHVHSAVTDVYSRLLEDELAIRKTIRSQVKLKEIVIEERNMPDADVVTDDDLVSAVPSKIVIYALETGSSFSMSLANFAKYLENDGSTSIFQDMTFATLLEHPKYQTEVHFFYSDEKLRALQRSLTGYSVDFTSWMARYDEMMDTEDDLSLKNYRLLLQDGEKMYSAISGTQRIFERFCFGENLNLEHQTELEKASSFKTSVENLRQFVEESLVVVEQCQTILSLKHQQRIRNGAAENTEHNEDDHSESLQLLVDLANKIPRLNFHTPEFDLVLEYQTEIQNFDKACRSLLESGSASLMEISDMINLGTSFGIHIPSLTFLIRLKGRLEWLETYEIIVSGGDPFSGKKDIFSLPDLDAFKEKGIKVLASGDDDKMATIDQYSKDGHAYDKAMQTYLSGNTRLNNVDLRELEAKIIDMEEKSKLKGPARLFVELKTYQKLVELKAQEKRIRFLQEFPSKGHGLFEIRQQLSDLASCTYAFDASYIREKVDQSNQWLRKFDATIAAIRVLSRPSKTVPAFRNTCTKSADQAKIIAMKTKTALCSDTTDLFETSSSFLFAHDLQDNFVEQTPIRYCLCREFEDGTMIECDSCHEWFHVTCVKDISAIGGDDERYVCPCCLELFKFQKTSQYPAFSDKLIDASLLALLQEGNSLQVTPMVEMDVLRELWACAEDAQRWFSDPETQRRVKEKGEIYQLFLLRKFVGSPLLVGSIVVYLLNLLRVTDVGKVSDRKVDVGTVKLAEPESVVNGADELVAEETTACDKNGDMEVNKSSESNGDDVSLKTAPENEFSALPHVEDSVDVEKNVQEKPSTTQETVTSVSAEVHQVTEPVNLQPSHEAGAGPENGSAREGSD